jgi:hypothetical protein
MGVPGNSTWHGGKNVTDPKATAAKFRETFCLASPGSDKEIESFLAGFDAAVNIFAPTADTVQNLLFEMNDFIRRVDVGEVRSVRTYARFKAAIAKAQSMFTAPAPAVDVVRELVDALRWYADPSNWIDTPSWDGDPDCTSQKAIPVTQQEGATICDCGDKARAALAASGGAA